MPLVAPPSAPVALPRFVTPPEPPPLVPPPAYAAPIVPMAMVGSAPVVPDLRPRSSRAIVFAFLGALVIGAGVGAYALMSKSSPAASAGSAIEVQTTSTPIVAPAAPVGETKPAPVKPVVETKPAPVKPVVETKPVVDKKPEPAVVETPPVERPKPVQQPVVKKPPPVVVQQPVVKKPPVKPKEQSWDPNSPFLPGQ
jgi:outer membrane biosynthesis protein TonB